MKQLLFFNQSILSICTVFVQIFQFETLMKATWNVLSIKAQYFQLKNFIINAYFTAYHRLWTNTFQQQILKPFESKTFF